jgi:phosphatidylserine/phosphatidylglycerophosphate/cardiolipin synthase-like enzyme
VNRDVYLGVGARDFAKLSARLEAAEASHFGDAVLVRPYMVHIAFQGPWSTLLWFSLAQVLVNADPMMHLRLSHARLDRLVLKNMKRLLLVLAILLTCAPHLGAQTPSLADIELVESIPAGTTLDNADIRNTREVWLEMIGRAKRTLDIEQFYISSKPGTSLEDVLIAIRKAANRGVKVRVIADAGMYRTYPESVDGLGGYPDIEARRIDFHAAAGGIQHAKYFIVDGNEVFVGSQNFDWRSLEHIHELGLRIRNQRFVSAYSDVFELDWQIAAMTPKQMKAIKVSSKRFGVPVRLGGNAGDDAAVLPTYSPVGLIPDPTRWDETAIVELINGAQKTLTLQFLSYSPFVRGSAPYTAIDGAIRKAAKRGVTVRMIVSDWEKGSPSVRALEELSALPHIDVAFTSIPEWSGGYIPFARVEHVKFIVADSETFWLGTSNCEKGYYYGSRNLGVICVSKRLAGRLAAVFQKSWDSSYRELITEKGKYAPREHGERK